LKGWFRLARLTLPGRRFGPMFVIVVIIVSTHLVSLVDHSEAHDLEPLLYSNRNRLDTDFFIAAAF
jgi:hypothetical protein